jgi:hypothetical protein
MGPAWNDYRIRCSEERKKENVQSVSHEIEMQRFFTFESDISV